MACNKAFQMLNSKAGVYKYSGCDAIVSRKVECTYGAAGGTERWGAGGATSLVSGSMM
jgi:hypothetical protein